jgi:hypothetical protein
MKMHMKLIAPLVVILLMGMGTSAFASLVCSASVPTAIARGALNGHMQNLADVLITCNPGDATATTTGTMTLAYNITLSGSTAIPAGHSVSITGATGSFAVAGQTPTISSANGTPPIQNGGPLTITIPAQGAPAAGTFTVSNVLGSLAGAGGGAVSANISVQSASGNTSTTGAPVTVLNAALNTLDGSTGTNPPALATGTAAAQFLPSGDPVPPNPGCSTAACADARATFHVKVSEAYVDAWRTPNNYFDNGVGVSANGTDISFTFAGMLPNADIQNGSAQISPAGAPLGLTGSGIANASGNATIVVTLGGGTTDKTQIETVTLDCGTSMAAPAYAKGLSTGTASTSITVSMAQSPIGTNLVSVMGTPLVSATNVPRYQAGTNVGPVTVINFSGAVTGQTTMLIPFATASGAASPPAGTFNTGVAIANTSGDPTAFGAGAATDSEGNVTFYLFPADGSAPTTITPATGCGLVGGVIKPGGSFICNLSTIMQAATPAMTGSFTGLVYIVANFSHAHGSAFVYGGGSADRLVSGTPIFVISNPSAVDRDTFGVLPTSEVVSN